MLQYRLKAKPEAPAIEIMKEYSQLPLVECYLGQGTGLGLSISHQIVTEKHNGIIRCDSTPEGGTQFVIEIPIHQSEPMST